MLGDILKKVIILCCIFTLPLFALDGEALSKKYHIPAGAKVSKQWIRIFNSEKLLKRYKLIGLSPDENKALLSYVIKHAADSDYPLVPGF